MPNPAPPKPEAPTDRVVVFVVGLCMSSCCCASDPHDERRGDAGARHAGRVAAMKPVEFLEELQRQERNAKARVRRAS